MNIVDLIDTRQGTNNHHTIGKGNVLPITATPFAMNHFVMQSRMNDVRFFNPNDATTFGVRLTHQASPWMGDFAFIIQNVFALTEEVYQQFKDTDDKARLLAAYQSSGYRANDATFQPNSLKYERLRDKLTVEYLPHTYGATINIEGSYLNRFTHPFISLGISEKGYLEVSEDGLTISGYTDQLAGSKYNKFGMYFVYHLSQAVSLVSEGRFVETEHPMKVYYLKFEEPIKKAHVDLGTSYISVDQAKANASQFVKEYADSESQRQFATQAWEDYLSKIEVSHKNIDLVKTFYSNLYRTATFPMAAHEVIDGEIKHYSPYNQKIEDGYFYTSNGYWDTFRSNYPLYAILVPERIPQFIDSILNIAKEDRYLPKWLAPDERGLMPGTLVDAVIADAVVKGFVDKDWAKQLLDAMIFNADTPSDHELEGREGSAHFAKYGYLPSDYHESVNKTLDYAYSDFCIAQVATFVGEKEIADQYYERSLNYRQLYNEDLKQMVAKDRDGQFVNQEVAHRWGQHYTEGSAWQNSLSVFHNVSDLIGLYGGDQAFYEHLTELVNSDPIYESGGYGGEIHEMIEVAVMKFGQLGISNQPGFHIPHLFTYAGYPHMSHIVLKNLMLNVFDNGVNGYPGDEDNGSLSAWYVMNSLGFYSVTPATDQYVLGISLWREAKIHLDNGNTIDIKSNADEAYLNIVQERWLNDEPYAKHYVTYDQLMSGVTIEQKVGMIPAIQSIPEENRPFSLKKTKK